MGTQQDFKQAFEWYFKAANNGVYTAQYNLGLCYLSDNYVQRRDVKEAIRWMKLAGVYYQLARTKLKQLEFEYPQLFGAT